MSCATFTRPLWALLCLYFLASLTHFAHNAEYIAYYPNMPAWLTREQVYLAWLAVTAVGATGLALAWLGWKATGLMCLVLYGALGLDGLAHYTLALCAEHTLATNLTIWFEVLAGTLLAAGAAVRLQQRIASGQ